MIDINQLIVIVLGLIGGGVLIVMERMNATRSSEIEALLTGAANQADKLLAGFGDRLKPIYEIAKTAESLIDEDTDFAVQNLPKDVIEAARVIVAFAERFTDGEAPAQEANPTVPPDPKDAGEVPNG